MLAAGGRAAMRSSPRLRAASPRGAARQVYAAAGATNRVSTTVRVATYNILSSALAPPQHFPGCRPEDLAASARLPRVLEKLADEVNKDAVICLQEVSLTWAGPLFAWFTERGYTFIPHFYGNPSNNYMGVGIAFRSSRYAAESVDICRLSDTKPWPRPPKATGARAWLKTQLTTGVVARLLQALRRSQPAQDPWSYARGRFNALVFLRLRDRETQGDFGIACYHMPCAYWAPPVMTIHAALAAQRVAALAKDGLPFALAGDWNFTPTSPMYRLLTQGGELPAGDPAAPVAPPHDSWAARVDVPLMSAYAAAHGAEPEFTNHAVVRDQPPFIECLDYIFVSPAVQVLAADALPGKAEVQGPYPTAKEPSDHVLLAATLRF